jgi:hypothetical protein
MADEYEKAIYELVEQWKLFRAELPGTPTP